MQMSSFPRCAMLGHLLYTQHWTVNVDKAFTLRPCEGGSACLITPGREGVNSSPRTDCAPTREVPGAPPHRLLGAARAKAVGALAMLWGREHWAKGTSRCFSRSERGAEPPSKPRSPRPVPPLPLSCRLPCFSPDSSFMIKHPSVNYLQYFQMNIRAAEACVSHMGEADFYGGERTRRKIRNSISCPRRPRSASKRLPAAGAWGGGSPWAWGGWRGLGGVCVCRGGTDSVLALEPDKSSLNLCCVIRCVTLSRYLNFSELQFPYL